MSGPINACPKCDGRSGFHYSVKVWDDRFGGWGQESESAEIRVVGFWPKTVVCDDCGRRVDLHTATGGELSF